MKTSALELEAERAALDRDARITAQQRRSAGVVHTPPLLARALVCAADRALRRQGLQLGLCDPRVLVVDPACGPGAFVAAVLTLAEQRGSAPGRLLALDIDAPAVLQVVDGFRDAAQALGCSLEARTCDALREGPDVCPEAEIVAVVGNPPWTTARLQASVEMQRLLDDFRQDAHGRRLQERKLGVLSDAYVRFFRLGAEIALRGTAGGALAFWSNASFIDGPVHRGMRRCLVSWFDELSVHDFGGSALLAREGAGSAGGDDNLFGVRPAVAMTVAAHAGFAIRTKDSHANVHYFRIAGRKRDKQRVLSTMVTDGAADTLSLARVFPETPRFSLRPVRASLPAYDDAPGLHEAMPFHREGVQTNRDRVVIDADRQQLLSRVRLLVGDGDLSEWHMQNAPHFSFSAARDAVRRVYRAGDAEPSYVRPIAYRPFDDRHFIALAPLCHRPRPALLAAMDFSAFALVSVRKDGGSAPYRHIAAVRHVPDSSYLSARSSCRTRAFPEFTPDGQDNLDGEVSAMFAERAQRSISVRDFAAYALAVISQPDYRERFGDALRRDFARVVLPRCPVSFERTRCAGEGLLSAMLEQSSLSSGVGPVGGAPAFETVVGHHRVTGAFGCPLQVALAGLPPVDWVE